MHTGKRYSLSRTLRWSSRDVIVPFVYACAIVAAYDLAGFKLLSIPTLPMSLIGVAVAFYLGFKNNASYDRLWEGRKIWGAIVNASRSWAYGVRDLVCLDHGAQGDQATLDDWHQRLVRRHVAWMDALRHQLRQVKSWEHSGPAFDALRKNSGVVEYQESLLEVLSANVGQEEAERAVSQINPALYLLSQQSRDLAQLRRELLVEGFGHTHLQEVLQALMAEQGKAERIKNFPFPRQYATVNSFFAVLFAALLPLGLLPEFAKLGDHMIWLCVPFSTVVSWVFLTTDRIGDWSENPFEGLPNDVPITTMSRGIERDILQLIGVEELPAPREASDSLQY